MLVRARRLRRASRPELVAGGLDPRAEELRRKLAESRDLEADRDEFEAAETPVDLAVPPPEVEQRRRRIHEEARMAAEEMRRPAADAD